MKVYFDNSATTAPCPEAVQAVSEAMTVNWGNPSSLHYSGNSANALLESSRKAVADRLGCDPGEVYFTSGGTESNNTALFGAAYQMRRQGSRIVTTSIEHPSVYEAARRLSAEGFDVVMLKPDAYGNISKEALFEAITPDTVLVSMMLVNNELGTVLPVQSIRTAVKRAKSPALIHCDAVQAFGKLPFTPASLGADLISVSSHKIHGPKGSGALYIRSKVKIKPLHYGGEQEKQLRPGTEAMPAIAGFGAAAKALPDTKQELERVTKLRDYLVKRLEDTGIAVINSPTDALPYITGISVPGIKSEPLLNYLSERGICISSGSACSKGKKSRVLTEIGLAPDRLESPVRISFSRYNTREEVDYFIQTLISAKRDIMPVKTEKK